MCTELCFYLDKGSGIKPVLGSNFKGRMCCALSVPGCLGTRFHQRIDPVVVGSRENTQVVHCCDSCSVLCNRIPNRGRIAGNSTVADVVPDLSTSEVTIMSDSKITNNRRASEQVKESTSVEERLFIVKVELHALGLRYGKECSETLSLKSIGKSVVKLNFGIKRI